MKMPRCVRLVIFCVLVVSAPIRGENDLHRAVRHGGKAVSDGAENFGKVVKKGANDLANAAEKAKHDSDAAIDKAVDDAAAATKKAIKDSGNTAVKAVNDTSVAAKKANADSDKAIDKAVNDAAVATKKALKDSGVALDKAEHDIAEATKKAGQDVGNEVVRTPANLERNRLALNRFIGREIKGTGKSLSDAEIRLRKGKVVDALWHLGTDPIRNTEENAAKLVQEGSLIRAVGQVAATAYGGPGGAAAYAAWYTFRATKNAELALRVGMITGATSFALGEAGKMPSASSAEVMRQAVVAGAIGGLAVAASGGNAASIREGFFESGAMILVQDGYEAVTKHALDGHPSYGEGYCLLAEPGGEFSPPYAAYSLDENGELLRDNLGNPIVDVTKTEAGRPHVGFQVAPGDTTVRARLLGERSPVMTTISRIPGMNAMALFHDQWCMSWKMSAFSTVATIAPAIVMTYVGFGTPFYDLLEKAAVNDANEQTLKPESHPAVTSSPTPDFTATPSVSPSP